MKYRKTYSKIRHRHQNVIPSLHTQVKALNHIYNPDHSRCQDMMSISIEIEQISIYNSIYNMNKRVVIRRTKDDFISNRHDLLRGLKCPMILKL